MKYIRIISVLTIFLFSFTLISGSYSTLFSQITNEEEVAELLKEADEYYQNGSFKKAIEIYERVIAKLKQKKELVKTKQKLFEIMISLAFTHFTIQENDKAEAQLGNVIRNNPNQDLDTEFYPPKFVEIFTNLQKKLLGSLYIESEPENVDIFLNDSKPGKTPLKIEKCLSGEYELRAELEGYQTVQKKITVAPNAENRENIVLTKVEEKKLEKEEALKPGEEKEEPKVVEKKGKEARKKKKISPLLIVAGAAAAAAVVVLLLSGKKEEKPRLVSRVFSNTTPLPITVAGGVSWIDVLGIPANAELSSVQVRAFINHPAMEDLSISLIGTDSRTSFLMRHRKPSPDPVTVVEGRTDAFNSLTPNGRWKLLVTNAGTQKGEIVEWHLEVFFYEK